MAQASGLYGLTIEKALIDTLGETWEAEDNPMTLVTSAYTPNFDTHDFYNDVTNEAATEQNLTSTELTLSSGVMKFDAADTTWAAATITNARAGIHRFNVGTDATDPLGFSSAFAADASSSGGDFVIVWHANGIWTLDYTP